MDLVLEDTKKTLTISDTIFGRDFNKALIHQVIVSYISGTHRGTRAQKTRSEVSGSGKKPWRQKGTGRARSGSIRSPIWRSGGVTFAARPQYYCQKVNKKMYRNALKSIVSELIRQNRLIVVEKFYAEIAKSKLLIQKIKNMDLENVLIITSKLDTNLSLASRNLHNVDVCDVLNIKPVSLITFDKVIMTIDAIKKLEEMLT